MNVILSLRSAGKSGYLLFIRRICMIVQLYKHLYTMVIKKVLSHLHMKHKGKASQ